MAYGRFQRLLSSSVAGTTTDIPCAIRGGILLSLQMQTVPNAYWDQATSDQRIQFGDLKVFVADGDTQSSPIGQVTTSASLISIPPNYTWRWENPYSRDIGSAASIIAKLGFAAGLNPQPTGVITTSALRFFVQADPVFSAPHQLQVEFEIIAFDLSGI